MTRFEEITAGLNIHFITPKPLTLYQRTRKLLLEHLKKQNK